MIINFKTAKFEKINEVFQKIGYDEYTITFLMGTKVHRLRIVVNGYITKETINLISFRDGYKNNILLAIKEYIEIGNENNKVVKKVTINYLKQFYSKAVISNVENYLIKINKEESRDKLTELGIFKLT